LPEGHAETITAPYWPDGTPAVEGAATSRPLPLTRTIYIERDDFAEEPPPGYKRLAPGRTVRLRHAHVITCTSVVKDAAGEVVEVRCTHEPASGGKRPDGTIHWVSADQALDVEVRLYDRLFAVETPGVGDADYLTQLNPRSLEVLRAKAEPSLAQARAGDRFQFERLGFFYAEPDSKDGAPVFNRVVPLKDSWAKAGAEPAAKKERKAEKSKEPAAAKAELSPEAVALRDAHGISDEAARVIAQEPLLGALLQQALSAPGGAQAAKAVALVLANEVLSEARARKLESVPFQGSALVELQNLVADGTLSSAQVKEVVPLMLETGKAPRAIVAEKGLSQISGADALGPIVDAVLAESADMVARYRAGNGNLLGALVGLVMKKSQGRANAKLVSDLLKQKLG
jgi:glutaminyl-tRNA synthetase